MTDSGFSMADFSSPEEYDFSWKIIMDPGKSCEKTRKLAIKNEKMQWRNPLHPGEGHFLKKLLLSLLFSRAGPPETGTGA